jgi:hypothetical protein
MQYVMQYIGAGLACVGMCGASLAVAILGVETARIEQSPGGTVPRSLRIYMGIALISGVIAFAVGVHSLFKS